MPIQKKSGNLLNDPRISYFINYFHIYIYVYMYIYMVGQLKYWNDPIRAIFLGYCSLPSPLKYCLFEVVHRMTSAIHM